ncbi:MAG: translation initiation factor IF-2 [Erysipelotrichales bacterium]|nr:translation initiation factor IF-2 [Erysipelotrichales bacterium]
MAYNGKNKNSKNNRVSNIPVNKNANKNDYNKVNGGVFVYTGNISVSQLSKELNVPATNIIKFLFLKGKMVTLNQNLDDELIGEICLEYGYDFKKEKVVSEENFEELEIVDDAKHLKERPPIVTIMGHVDHGKTTLIDTIRNSNIVATEAGAITQAIGAYQKEIKGKKITFIDTPGHEAFTQMRSRGASVTDIVIIVVAADDGVMPQTREAIDHAKAAKVPIIIAINKIDKPGADTDRVKQELMTLNIVAEEYGGDTIFCEISAKKNIGIEELLENVLVLAEMQELKANPNRYAMGTVLEAKLDKGEGAKATLLVQNGTLNASDFVVVGAAYGRVRKMTNEYRAELKVAGPSTPVAIIGLTEVPVAGDKFMAFPTEKQAREIAEKRKLAKAQDELNKKTPGTLEDLYNRIHEGEIQEINVIIRADNQGSAEAVKGALQNIQVEGVRINVLRATAGAITETDVLLASTSSAIIFGFNIRPDALIRKKAEEEKVEIRLHTIIYHLTEEVEAAMKGMLKPTYREQVTGQAEIRKVIVASRIGKIGGSMVTNGVIKRDSLCRLLRDGVVIYEGKISSLKRFQNDAKEVAENFECGLTIENFNDIKEGDIVEGYEMVEVKK